MAHGALVEAATAATHQVGCLCARAGFLGRGWSALLGKLPLLAPPLQLPTRPAPPPVLALELLDWLEDWLEDDELGLKPRLAASPAVQAFVLRAAHSLSSPRLTLRALHVAELLTFDVPGDLRGGMDALAPLAGRLLVNPLHPWPPGSPLRPASPQEEAEAAARLQHAAILFLTNVMNSPDVRARVLATAPGFWEVLAARYRRERAAGVVPRDTPHCAILLVGTLLGVRQRPAGSVTG